MKKEDSAIAAGMDVESHINCAYPYNTISEAAMTESQACFNNEAH
jgi:hypothetical protein